jgi:hypothetical protein
MIVIKYSFFLKIIDIQRFPTIFADDTTGLILCVALLTAIHRLTMEHQS